MTQSELDRHFAIAHDQSQSEDDRTTAIHAMGRLPAELAIPKLIILMKDDSLAVRWTAASAMRKYGRAMLLPLLQALATHPADHRFYESAHHALSRFGNPVVEELLAPLLEALTQTGAAEAAPIAAMQAQENLQMA